MTSHDYCTYSIYTSITLGSPVLMGALVGGAIACTMASRSPESIDGGADTPAIDGARGDDPLGSAVQHPTGVAGTH